MQAVGDGRQLRGGRGIADLVPGLNAAYHLELSLLAHQRDPAATAGTGFSLRTDKLVPHRWCVVIDGAGVALQVKAWRRRSRRRTHADFLGSGALASTGIVDQHVELAEMPMVAATIVRAMAEDERGSLQPV